MNDMLKTASEGVSLVGEIIKAAGDNPQVKEAGSNLGQTALTITKTINNALMPLAAVNFAFDKARRYFNEKFAADLSSRVATIPLENISEPKASIAGPALQGLAFTHEEPSLKDMFLALLATAMDSRSAAEAHPAFVEIIKQLDGLEARLLKIILSGPGLTPIVRFRLATAPGTTAHGDMNVEHLIDYRNPDGSSLVVPRGAAIVENWSRLGLVRCDYEATFVPSTEQAAPYAWVENHPEHARLRSEYRDGSRRVVPKHGILTVTALGRQFALATGLKQ